MPGSSKWFLSFSFLHLNPGCTSPLPYTCWSYTHIIIILDFITQVVLVRITDHSLYISVHPPVTSSLSGPNIFLSTLLRNTLNMCSSFNVRDQFSFPYKTAGKISVLNIF
jgi:hypothetical protein